MRTGWIGCTLTAQPQPNAELWIGNHALRRPFCRSSRNSINGLRMARSAHASCRPAALRITRYTSARNWPIWATRKCGKRGGRCGRCGPKSRQRLSPKAQKVSKAGPPTSPISMRHTISVLVENKFGVLTRMAGLFSGRGYNIDTLNVAPTQDPNTSRMTIVTRGDNATMEQIVKQISKLIDVLEVTDFREYEYIDRELVLVRVKVDGKTRAEVMQITDIFRAKIVDVQTDSLTVEVTGNES